MKKSLFAVAAMSAIAGAAQAQSSVTVYGIMDMGYVGSNAKTVTAAGVVTKNTTSSFGQSQEQTSRLGFKGTEDLGGGTSAFFTVEMGLTPQNPNIGGGGAKDTLQYNDNNGGSTLDNRQSFVGLKKNGLGQLALGRQYTPIFNAGAVTDASQYANVVGNVVYQGSSIAGTSTDSGIGAGSYNNSFTNRASNALSFKSDKFAGFSASGLYAINMANTTQGLSTQGSTAGGNVNWSGWGLSADYTWQKLYATFAYQSFKTQYSNNVYSSATTTNVGQAITSGQSVAATNLFQPNLTADKQSYAGVTYDFGILKAYAQWSGRKVQNDTAYGTTVAGAQANRTAQQLGVRSYITPTIEAWGSVGNGKYTGPIAASGLPASVSFLGWQVGSNYYLSKRTNLYGIYGQTQSTSGTANTAGSGATSNQYTVGVRHTF